MKEIKVFDFDGTIFSKNAIDILIRVKFYNSNLITFLLWFVFILIKIPIFLYLYKKDALRFNIFLYKHYKGFRLEYLEHFAQNKGFEFIRDNIFIESLETIHFSPQIIIISAGLDIFLVPFFSRLGIDPKYIFANSLEFSNGVCTGKIKGNVIDNEEKAKYALKVKTMFPDSKLFIYGNSKWDYPMLKVADHAFCINPSQKIINFFHDKSLKITFLYWKRLFFRINIIHGALATKFTAKIFSSKLVGNKIEECGSIIIANHQSYVDHYLISSVVKNYNFCFIAKKEHFNSKLGRLYHSLTRIIPIDRDNPFNGMKTLLIARYAILLGINVIIYPEGTRSSGKEMNRFKKGFLKLAGLFPEIKIIPITINNSYKILKKGSKVPNFFHKAQIIIHQPILVKDGFNEQEVLDQCFNTIKSGFK